MDKVGRQDPTVSVVLPYHDTKGPEAIELYNKSEHDALDWQVRLTYDMMAVDDEGLWVHQKFGYAVPRRNGKSEMALGQMHLRPEEPGEDPVHSPPGQHSALHLGAAEQALRQDRHHDNIFLQGVR